MSIFYKVTALNGRVSYLFGTIHKNDAAFVTLGKRYEWFPNIAYAAFMPRKAEGERVTQTRREVFIFKKLPA